MSDIVVTEHGMKAVGDGKKLNPRQRQLIRYLVNDGLTREQAAIKAGYSENSARSAASQALNCSEGEAYRQILTQRKANDLANKALFKAGQLLDCARSERVRMEVAQDLMDRAGMRAPERKEVNVQGEISISIDLGE